MIRSCVQNLSRKIQWGGRNFSVTSTKFSDDINKAVKQKEAPQIDNKVILSPEEVSKQKDLEEYISIKPEIIAPISGIPAEHIKTRRVRIYQPAKNAMQSGTNNIQHWQVDFETRERWENPLMGWTSSGDPHSNLKMEFASMDDAVKYCEKYGWKWYVQNNKTRKPERAKSYAVNFSWNKRTRVSTK